MKSPSGSELRVRLFPKGGAVRGTARIESQHWVVCSFANPAHWSALCGSAPRGKTSHHSLELDVKDSERASRSCRQTVWRTFVVYLRRPNSRFKLCLDFFLIWHFTQYSLSYWPQLKDQNVFLFYFFKIHNNFVNGIILVLVFTWIVKKITYHHF